MDSALGQNHLASSGDFFFFFSVPFFDCEDIGLVENMFVAVILLILFRRIHWINVESLEVLGLENAIAVGNMAQSLEIVTTVFRIGLGIVSLGTVVEPDKYEANNAARYDHVKGLLQDFDFVGLSMGDGAVNAFLSSASATKRER